MSRPKPVREWKETTAGQLEFKHFPPSRTVEELNARLERRVLELAYLQGLTAKAVALSTERRKVTVIGLGRIEEIVNDYCSILKALTKDLSKPEHFDQVNREIESLEWQMEKWFAIVETAFNDAI